MLLREGSLELPNNQGEELTLEKMNFCALTLFHSVVRQKCLKGCLRHLCSKENMYLQFYLVLLVVCGTYFCSDEGYRGV